MGGDEPNQDEPEFKRRDVLSGVGGFVAAGSVVDIDSNGGDTLADKLASDFEGVETARDRRELAFLLEELQADAQLLRNNDVEDLDPATRREFAGKGRRFKALMTAGGECGYEGYEIYGGCANPCCAAHDSCEGHNDAPDHVFNGDHCDDFFWGCVGNYCF